MNEIVNGIDLFRKKYSYFFRLMDFKGVCCDHDGNHHHASSNGKKSTYHEFFLVFLTIKRTPARFADYRFLWTKFLLTVT